MIKRPRGLVLGLALAGASASCSARAAPPDAELLDYLVQDVCLDAQDRVTAADPATCTRHRDIRVGEPSPYLMTDRDRRTGASFQGMASLPFNAPDGSLVVLALKTLQGGFDADFTFSFRPERDAYDLIDTSRSAFASVIRTHDPTCRDQIVARAPQATSPSERAGGWVLFPKTAPSRWPQSASMQVTTYITPIGPGPRCAAGHATGLTAWRSPAPYRFESGRRLLGVRSDHYAQADLGATENALERFYFTREYGFTRWEQWTPQARCFAEKGAADPACHPGSPGDPLAGRCGQPLSASDRTPGLETAGGQAWVRRDCRDESYWLALRRPQILLAHGMAEGDGLQDLRR